MTVAIEKREKPVKLSLLTRIRRPWEFVLPKPESEVLNIRNPYDVEKVVNQAKQGIPFGFAGLGVYGFAGTKEDMIEAARLKTEAAKALGSEKVRNLEKDPPVCLPSWPLLRAVADWEKLAGDKFEPEELKLFFRHLYSRFIGHPVVPLKENMADLFLHPRRREMKGEQAPTYAFMLTGINAELQNLIYTFETECQSPMHVMSANPAGERSITMARKFVETFPGVPVLVDSIMERTMPDYPSHTMIDLIYLPTTGVMVVIRKGSGDPELLRTAIADFGWQERIKVIEAPDVKVLEGARIENAQDLAEIAVDLYDWKPLKKS